MLDIFTDGASSGNPGPAGIGVVIKESGKVLLELSREIGQTTNNVAEYKAIIEALKEAGNLKANHIRVHTDSELLFNQIRGSFKVKSEDLKPLHDEVMVLAKSFGRVEMKRVPREENREADLLAKGAIKHNASQDGCPDVFVIGEESPSSRG